MDFENLTDEQRAKARACATPEEIMSLAKEEGYELSEEELDGIAGGGVWSSCNSPFRCGNDAGCYGNTR